MIGLVMKTQIWIAVVTFDESGDETIAMPFRTKLEACDFVRRELMLDTVYKDIPFVSFHEATEKSAIEHLRWFIETDCTDSCRFESTEDCSSFSISAHWI